MFARFAIAAAWLLVAHSVVCGADERRRRTPLRRSGKLFAFTCFDGSRGDGRIYADGSVIGTIQMQGSGPYRNMWLPAGTVYVKGEAVCATLKGMPFEPCFNLNKTDDKQLPRRGVRDGLRLLRLHAPQQAGVASLSSRSRGPLSLNPPAAARAN